MAGRVTVGLDIGTSGVRAAELSLGRGGVTLEHFGQVALPPGAVSNGEVVDEDAVASAIKRLWKDGGFSTKRVALGVANQKVVVRQVDLVWMEPTELRKALSFQVQDYIPIPVEDAVLDFHPIEEFTNEDGARMIRVLLVAAARNMVRSTLQSVSKAGLRATAVDLTAFALIRAAVHLGEFDLETAATAVVDVGSRVTNIVVHQNGIPRFVRILLMGGGDVTDTVAERLGVPAEHAEGLKQQPIAADTADATARAIQASTASFVEEVRGSLDYYRAAPGSVQISRLLVTGGASRLHNLIPRLGEATRLPVTQANFVSKLRLGKTGLSEEQLRYSDPLAAVPIGLALGVAS